MNKISLSNVSNLTREGVNKFTGDLQLVTGPKLPISFTRSMSGWHVDLLVSVAGRGWHTFDGNISDEADAARVLWRNLDQMAMFYTDKEDTKRGENNPAIRASLMFADNA